MFEAVIGYDGEDVTVQVEVTDYYKQKPSDTWASDWDNMGYTDFECIVYLNGEEIEVDDDTFRQLQSQYERILDSEENFVIGD